MPHDAKHSIFLSESKGSLGLCSFTLQYLSALLRDVEVYMSNDGSMPAHALITSLSEATKQALWMLLQENRTPENLQVYNQIQNYKISGKRILIYQNTFDHPAAEIFSYEHRHCMAKAVQSTCAYGFMLRDFNQEWISRYTDNLLLADKNAKTIGSSAITNRVNLGAYTGIENKHFSKYAMLGHIYLLLSIIMEELIQDTHNDAIIDQDAAVEDKVCKPMSYKQIPLFVGEISPTKLASTAKENLTSIQK